MNLSVVGAPHVSLREWPELRSLIVDPFTKLVSSRTPVASTTASRPERGRWMADMFVVVKIAIPRSSRAAQKQLIQFVRADPHNGDCPDLLI